MKEFKNYILLFSSLLMAMPLAAQDCKSLKLAADKIQVSHVEMSHHSDLITVMMDLNLDSLDLPTNNQLVYTPIIKHKGELLKMPEIVSTVEDSRSCLTEGLERNSCSFLLRLSW